MTDRLTARQLAQPTQRPVPRRPDEIYQLETLRPIVCLVFVTPILLIYELGIVFCDSPVARNGVETGVQWVLQGLGAGQLLLLPLLTILALLAMHHRRRDRAGFRFSTLAGMVVESAGLGLILLCAAKAHQLWFLEHSQAFLMAVPGLDATALVTSRGGWESFVSFCGAGLYEELVFRLLLLSGLVLGLRRLGFSRVIAISGGLLLTSVVFAAAHYQIVNPAGAVLDLPTFVIRFLASLFFCTVFLLRGFGVAVGTHIAYDLLAQW